MEKIIFAIHSVVDIITNSSTEIFIIDADQEVSIIEAIIKEKEKEFPTEYNYRVHVSQTDEWEVKDMFGYIDEDQAVKYLKAIGYKVEKSEKLQPLRYITISCERGCMNSGLKSFIRNTFTIVEDDTNG